jgi:hypothetical protein
MAASAGRQRGAITFALQSGWKHKPFCDTQSSSTTLVVPHLLEETHPEAPLASGAKLDTAPADHHNSAAPETGQTIRNLSM